MFGLFSKNYDIKIAELNKIIGDLQEKIDKLETRIEDLNIDSEVEHAIEKVDVDSMAENAIEEAINRMYVRFG